MCLISSDADLATLDHLESLRNRGAVPISKSQGELHSRKRRSYLLSASPLALVLVRLDYSAPNCPDDLTLLIRMLMILLTTTIMLIMTLVLMITLMALMTTSENVGRACHWTSRCDPLLPAPYPNPTICIPSAQV